MIIILIFLIIGIVIGYGLFLYYACCYIPDIHNENIKEEIEYKKKIDEIYNFINRKDN